VTGSLSILTFLCPSVVPFFQDSTMCFKIYHKCIPPHTAPSPEVFGLELKSFSFCFSLHTCSGDELPLNGYQSHCIFHSFTSSALSETSQHLSEAGGTVWTKFSSASCLQVESFFFGFEFFFPPLELPASYLLRPLLPFFAHSPVFVSSPRKTSEGTFVVKRYHYFSTD